MDESEQLAIATRATYEAILQYAANETGVSAVDALRISAGLLGQSLLFAHVGIEQLKKQQPGTPFIHQSVSEALQVTVDNLLQIAVDEGLDPRPESGWKSELPPEYILPLSDLLKMVNSRASAFSELLSHHGLTYHHATFILVFVVCRLIREVSPVITEPIAKGVVMLSLYSCAKSVPLLN